MSSDPITSDDLGAALTGFAIALVAVLKPKLQNQVLAELANELHDFASKVPDTPAGKAFDMTARMLIASEPVKSE